MPTNIIAIYQFTNGPSASVMPADEHSIFLRDAATFLPEHTNSYSREPQSLWLTILESII